MGRNAYNDVRKPGNLATFSTLYRWTMQAHRRLEQRPRLRLRLLQPRRKKHHPPPELEPRRLRLRRKMIRKVAAIPRGGLRRGHRLESLREAPPEQHHQVSIASSSRVRVMAFIHTGRVVAMSIRFSRWRTRASLLPVSVSFSPYRRSMTFYTSVFYQCNARRCSRNPSSMRANCTYM